MREWRKNGAEIVLIGSGTRAFAQAFREDFDLQEPVLIDPDLRAYRAAELRRGRVELASPKLFTNALRALGSGARQTGVQGDPWQLGGVFVFAAGGELRFRYASREAGDHAAPEDIAAALESDAEAIPDAPLERSPLAPVADWVRPLLDAGVVGSFDRVGFARHALGFDPSDLEVDLYGRRCLITGANSGIGYETSLALADLGAEVVMLCRSRERGQAAAERVREATGNRRVEFVQLDVSDLDAVDAVAEQLSKQPVDVLVHNAGVLPDERLLSEQGHEITFATHVLGPHRLTQRLRGALEASDDARVVWVSSGGMLLRRLNLEDPEWASREYDGVLAYAETKRAQVVLGELWAEQLADTRVSVHSMHPGWADTPAVETSLPRFHQLTRAILRTPAEGADTVVWLAAAPGAAARSGLFFFDRQPARTHWIPGTRESERDRRELWELCEAHG